MNVAATDKPIARDCRDCGRGFTITTGEQEYLLRLFGAATKFPTACLFCRQARRRARYSEPVHSAAPDERLTCVDCGIPFIFGGRDREYFAAQGFATPKRCRDCRRARSTRESEITR